MLPLTRPLVPCVTVLLGLMAAVVAGWTVPAPASAATASQQAFIASLVKGARGTQSEFGVPASITLAQAILESGWGGSTLAKAPYNNLFGIKCGTVASPFQSGCVSLPTQEYVNGQWVTITASFRTYATVSDSIYDHGYYLRYRGIYDAAFPVAYSPRLFVNAIAAAGYATDPSYAQKVLNVAWANNLFEQDWGTSLGSAVTDPRVAQLTVAGAQVARAGAASTSVTVKAKPSQPGKPVVTKPARPAAPAWVSWRTKRCGPVTAAPGRIVATRPCR